jgi:hypothetical protein
MGPHRNAHPLAALLLAACGTPVVNGIDSSQPGITSFVKAKGYASWTAQPAVHPSEGPHGKVRVYFNETLLASLRAGAVFHPRGAAAVKEFYASDGTTLAGHVVMVKTREGTDKDAWTWFEGHAPDYTNPFYGPGIAVCHDCHGDATDEVWSPAP